MLPTPSTSHVSFNTIYEPAEDSFLLLDTLSSASESTWLSERFSHTTTTDNTLPSSPSLSPSPLLVEVGTGSGVVIAFLAAHSAAIFGREDVLCLGVDVNRDACRATAQTVRGAVVPQTGAQGSGAIYLGSLCADLTACLSRRRDGGQVDVLVFNPPYVPTAEMPSLMMLPKDDDDETNDDEDKNGKFQRESHLLSLSYAGGIDGMETTDRLLAQVPEVLSERGVAYVLFCRQNRPEEVKERIKGWKRGGSQNAKRDWKWAVETVGSSGKRAGWEKLEIVRIWRQKMN